MESTFGCAGSGSSGWGSGAIILDRSIVYRVAGLGEKYACAGRGRASADAECTMNCDIAEVVAPRRGETCLVIRDVTSTARRRACLLRSLGAGGLPISLSAVQRNFIWTTRQLYVLCGGEQRRKTNRAATAVQHTKMSQFYVRFLHLPLLNLI